MIRTLSLITLLGLLLGFTACSPKLSGPEPTVEDLLSEAKAVYEKEEYGLAKEKFEAIRFDYPGDALIGEVQFYIGLCYFQLKEFVVAQQEFESFLREFPQDNPFADDAMYYLSRCLFEQALPARLDQALTKKTLEQVDAFLETYASSPFYGEVRTIKERCVDRLAMKEFLAGQLYRRMDYTSSAIHYFRLLEKDFSGSRWILRGRYEWARALYQQKNFTEARLMADTCRTMLEDYSSREKDELVRTDPYGFGYRLVHLFGLIGYEKRSEIKIFIDDLNNDVADLTKKIDKKIKKQSERKSS